MANLTQKKRSVLDELVSKVKMTDAGEQMGKGNCCTELPKSEERIYYPSLYLNTKQSPDLEGYEVGDECTFLVKGKVTSHSLNEDVKDNKRETFNIDITKIGIIKK